MFIILAFSDKFWLFSILLFSYHKCDNGYTGGDDFWVELPEIFSLNSRKFFDSNFQNLTTFWKGIFCFTFAWTFLEIKYFDLNSKCSKILGLVFYLGEIFLLSFLPEMSLNNHLVQKYFFSFLFDITKFNNGLKGILN